MYNYNNSTKAKIGIEKYRLPFVLIGNLDVDKALGMRQFMRTTETDAGSALPTCLGLPCKTQARQGLKHVTCHFPSPPDGGHTGHEATLD